MSKKEFTHPLHQRAISFLLKKFPTVDKSNVDDFVQLVFEQIGIHSKQSVYDLLQEQYDHEQVLMKRIRKAAEVVWNTKRKFIGDAFPEELEWVNKQIVKVTKGEDDNIKIFALNGSGRLRTYIMPESFLLNDPIVVAQFTRRSIRNTRESIAANEVKDLKFKLELLQGQIAKAEAELADHQERLALLSK